MGAPIDLQGLDVHGAVSRALRLGTRPARPASLSLNAGTADAVRKGYLGVPRPEPGRRLSASFRALWACRTFGNNDCAWSRWEDSLERQLLERCASQGTGGTHPVPRVRVEDYDPARLGPLVRQGLPIIFEGLLDEPMARNRGPKGLNQFDVQRLQRLFLTRAGSLQNMMGEEGQSRSYRSDPFAGLCAQLHGRSQWRFVDPRCTAWMYPSVRSGDAGSFLSPVVTEEQDRDPWRYPLYEQVPKWKATLEAGDLLFVPKRWWNEMRCLSASISVGMRVCAER